MIIETFFLFLFLILIAIFLLSERADLTASASLQGTCGEGPQLHTLWHALHFVNGKCNHLQIYAGLFDNFSYPDILRHVISG